MLPIQGLSDASISTDIVLQIRTLPFCTECIRHITSELLRRVIHVHADYSIVFKADSIQRSTE